MKRTNQVNVPFNDEEIKKFKEYWSGKEKQTGERMYAGAVARDLILYALKNLNGNSPPTNPKTQAPDSKPETEQLAPTTKADFGFDNLDF